MILIPRPFSILQIRRTCIVFQVFTRHPLRRFFFNGSGVISPSCRDFSRCCLTLFWLNRQCSGCSPYASTVALQWQGRSRQQGGPSAAGGDQVWLQYLVRGDRLFCRGQSRGTAFEGGLSTAWQSYVEGRLWFSHIVELWFWCLQGPSLSLRWCFVIPGCMVMVILYSRSGVRSIPWSRFKVRVPAHCVCLSLGWC